MPRRDGRRPGKEEPIEVRVRALKPVYGGYALARDEGVVLVRGALPGELVEVEVLARKKDYALAKVVSVLEPSPDRIEPPCPVYGRCGGCQIQHAAYPRQLALKALVLADVLRRTAAIDRAPDRIEGSEPFGYRYRGQFKTSGGKIGFYREGSRELVSVEACPLMIGAVNGRLAAAAEIAAMRDLREVHIASDGLKTLFYLKGLARDPAVAEVLRALSVDGAAFEDGRWGQEEITLRLGETAYSVTARSFFQANWALNARLVDRVLALVERLPGGRILDLYAGAGNFSVPLARRAGEVVAVEGDRDAFRDLQGNVDRNGARSVRPVNARVERFRPSGRFDIVLVDPPRTGLSDKAFRLVRAVAAPLLLYISCSPPTLARDLVKLAPLYDIHLIELYDFFPNSYHIESLAVLRRRDGRSVPWAGGEMDTEHSVE